jgi:hypothetical protein
VGNKFMRRHLNQQLGVGGVHLPISDGREPKTGDHGLGQPRPKTLFPKQYPEQKGLEECGSQNRVPA